LKMKIFLPIVLGAGLLASSASAQLFNFTTLAGSAGTGTNDGIGTNALFNHPGGAAMDWNGNIFVADTASHTIRKISPAGTVSTFAGSPGISGSADGTNALFNSPQAVAADSAGNVYVADTGNFTIRKITPGGVVSTLAGSPGISGSADGTNAAALFFEPEAVAVDGAGNVFVADTWNHTIRKTTPAGAVTTIAGSPGIFGSTDANGTNALFYEPQGMAVDASGDIFVADTGNNTIREIAPGGNVSTIAGWPGNFGSADATGTNAIFNSPRGMSIDGSGNLLVADYLNHTVREISSAGAVTTIAGSPGIFGSVDGTNGSARFRGLQGVVVNPTNNNLLCVADTGNSTIRQLAASGGNWVVTTPAGNASIGSKDLTGGAARFFWPMGAALDSSGNLYVADAGNDTIRKVTPAGAVTTVAGTPGIAGSADGTVANALFNSPQAVAVDAAGNIFVSDTGNGTVREITSGGSVSTIAGSAGNFGSADGTNTGAQFFEPEGIAVDASDNVCVADTFNHTLRKITAAGVVTTLAGSPGISGSADGTNNLALFNRPTGLAMDGSGNLFVTDLFNHTIRKVTAAGVVTTLAGLAGNFGSADGTNSYARFFEPEGIAVSGTTIFIADSGNHSLRQLTPVGTNWLVSTVAGWPGNSGSADGSGIAARFSYPAGLAVNTNGILLAVDSGNDTIRAGSMITNNPPVIISQPQSVAVNMGTAAAFNISASGSPSLYFQWQFNGASVPGANATSFNLPAAQPANAGTYTVTVTSPTGSVSSSNATLTVYAPPVITNQPISQQCLQGTNVTFSVLAGTPPLTYQWQKNGVTLFNSGNISGATTAALAISNTTTADSAGYSVVIGNGHGFTTSSTAALTVFFVPTPDSPSPYAWWLLNEGVGTAAFDYSGNNHNGTLNTGVLWTNTVQMGNGAFFIGTNPASIAIANPFLIITNWTATFWVNRWGSKNSSVLLGGQSYALKLEQASSGSHVGFTHYGVKDYALNYGTPQNTWTHLAFVETNSVVSLYVNGTFVTSSNTAASLNATTLGFGLTAGTSDYLDATLDDVRVYTNALTAQQVTNLFAFGRAAPIPAITLTAPANGTNFIVSSNIALAATVASNGQNMVRVEFRSSTTNLLGQAAAPPYAWTWTNAAAGSYVLTARAVFNGANTVDSAPVGIVVVPSTNSASISFTAGNGSLQLSWPLDHTGWRLQVQTNLPTVGLTTNWADVSGATATNQISVPVNPANGNVFYRLIYP
jgi:sugar lactone lactonase YvrE